MTRKEKNNMTRQKIIDSAIIEFGTHSYKEASLNKICSLGNISKGIIYHYFDDKDDLYLYCVKKVFEGVGNSFTNITSDTKSVENSMLEYVDTRKAYFDKHPYFENIFTSALLQTPKHLLEDIKEIKKSLDKTNRVYYKQLFTNVTLNQDITIDEAIDYLFLFQESLNNSFRSKSYDDNRSLVHDHDLKIRKLLKILLYGILKEEV
ncbi:MAG: TetR/AcrR family transcriptional regulator [Erysipelothrix sp.]|nr:TetR/AcrR family transcriptional regulator [Erysipelothrix sp.]